MLSTMTGVSIIARLLSDQVFETILQARVNCLLLDASRDALRSIASSLHGALYLVHAGEKPKSSLMHSRVKASNRLGENYPATPVAYSSRVNIFLSSFKAASCNAAFVKLFIRVDGLLYTNLVSPFAS
jgi:hypothetical protein